MLPQKKSMCSPAELPNVFPESETFHLEGRLLVVRNTFVDVLPAVEEKAQRSRSMPLRSVSNTESLSNFRLRELRENRVQNEQSEVEGGKQPLPQRLEVQAEERRTTVMLRNIPMCFTRTQLEELLDAEGFRARYDFLYLPAELRTGVCFGYAFVNLVTTRDALHMVRHFQGYARWSVVPAGASQKAAVAHLSESLQGLEELIARYRNSPLMHQKVPEKLRPSIYRNGTHMPFPSPALRIRRPRVRTSEVKRQPVHA